MSILIDKCHSQPHQPHQPLQQHRNKNQFSPESSKIQLPSSSQTSISSSSSSHQFHNSHQCAPQSDDHISHRFDHRKHKINLSNDMNSSSSSSSRSRSRNNNNNNRNNHNKNNMKNTVHKTMNKNLANHRRISLFNYYYYFYYLNYFFNYFFASSKTFLHQFVRGLPQLLILTFALSALVRMPTCVCAIEEEEYSVASLLPSFKNLLFWRTEEKAILPIPVIISASAAAAAADSVNNLPSNTRHYDTDQSNELTIIDNKQPQLISYQVNSDIVKQAPSPIVSLQQQQQQAQHSKLSEITETIAATAAPPRAPTGSIASMFDSDDGNGNEAFASSSSFSTQSAVYQKRARKQHLMYRDKQSMPTNDGDHHHHHHHHLYHHNPNKNYRNKNVHDNNNNNNNNNNDYRRRSNRICHSCQADRTSTRYDSMMMPLDEDEELRQRIELIKEQILMRLGMKRPPQLRHQPADIDWNTYMQMAGNSINELVTNWITGSSEHSANEDEHSLDSSSPVSTSHADDAVDRAIIMPMRREKKSAWFDLGTVDDDRAKLIKTITVLARFNLSNPESRMPPSDNVFADFFSQNSDNDNDDDDKLRSSSSSSTELMIALEEVSCSDPDRSHDSTVCSEHTNYQEEDDDENDIIARQRKMEQQQQQQQQQQSKQPESGIKIATVRPLQSSTTASNDNNNTNDNDNGDDDDDEEDDGGEDSEDRRVRIKLSKEKANNNLQWFEYDVTEMLTTPEKAPIIDRLIRIANKDNFDILNSAIKIEWTNVKNHRAKRSIDCTEKVSFCCRQHFYVNFTTIGWNNWIFQPPGYNANYCKGKCDLSHARYHHTTVIGKYPAIKLCCSPREMSSISLIYMDDKFNIYQKNLPNMVVESCDCA